MTSTRKKLTEMARVIRSKNSGPFTLTLDILLQEPKDFYALREKNAFTPELIGGLYGIDPKMVQGIIYFEPAFAVKIVLPRPRPSGSPGDTDVYGAQQHAPLLDLDFQW